MLTNSRAVQIDSGWAVADGKSDSSDVLGLSTKQLKDWKSCWGIVRNFVSLLPSQIHYNRPMQRANIFFFRLEHNLKRKRQLHDIWWREAWARARRSEWHILAKLPTIKLQPGEAISTIELGACRSNQPDALRQLQSIHLLQGGVQWHLPKNALQVLFGQLGQLRRGSAMQQLRVDDELKEKQDNVQNC